MRHLAICAVAIALGTHAGQAAQSVRGTVTHFQSPAGVAEECVALDPIPGGFYSEQDRAEEKSFCAIDFHVPSVALCPKTWSTSAGTLVYDISSGTHANDPARFEREICRRGASAREEATRELAKNKQTINTPDSSATFSTASLLYYHLSRYFDTTVNVPVAVYRSMDKDSHRRRVTELGIRLTANKPSLRMIHAGWSALREAESNPESYRPTDELFTADRKRIYGILILTAGERYNSEINGTRESGWGSGQNRDFQHTAPYLALQSLKPLAEAIREGVEEAIMNPRLARDMGPEVLDEQMVFWMQELTEITLLDFIFSQQDRIGNIDYRRAWYWIEDGRVRSRAAHGKEPPEAITGLSPILLKRTWINDNDAGGRAAYVDFAEKTEMLEKIRHFNADTYRRLLALDSDFSQAGPLYAYFRDTFGLSQRQLGLIVRHTAHATAILRETCRAGELRFDLEPETFLVDGGGSEPPVDCNTP